MTSIFEWGKGTPSTPILEDRYCWCGTKLNMWNKGTTCYVHDGEDCWDEYVKLADEYRWGTKKDVSEWTERLPSPEEGETCTSFVKRLFSTEEAIPVSSICFHYGYSTSEVKSAVSGVKRWYARRGYDCQQAGGYGDGYKLVPMDVV
jgi:hypothetical protein